MKKLLLLLIGIVCLNTQAQNNHKTTSFGCNNADFETGDFTGWIGAIGYNGNSHAPLTVTSASISTLGNNSPETSCSFHTILTAGGGADPYSGLPTVSPAGGMYACRLGGENINLSCDEFNPNSLYSQHFGVVSPTVACTSNDPVMTNTASPQFGNQFFSNGESMQQTINVTAANFMFFYNYAVVLSDAPHTGAEINYFKVEVLDATNTIAPCLTYIVQKDTISNNLPPGFFISSNLDAHGGQVICSPWQQNTINLMPYIGQNVTVRFTVAGCTQGGHFAYAYIDCGCSNPLFPIASTGCVTGNASITAYAQLGGTYAWAGPGIVSGTSLQTVSVNQPGTYSVTVTTPQGCSLTVDTTISYTQAPTLTVSNNTSICPGGSTTLTASGAASYTWIPAANLSNPNVANPVATPTATTVYTVTGTATTGSCNPGPVTVTVTVNSVPTISLQINSVSCNGMCNGSATATASNGLSPYNFIWLPTGGTISNSSPTSIINNLCAGTYSCIVTDANSCTDIQAVTIAQPSQLAMTYTLVQDVAPHTWDLFYTATGGSSPYTYSWNWGDGNTTIANYPTHVYSTAGTYSICATLTDANGCTTTYCQNDAVFRLGNNSTYSNMVNVNVLSGAPGALAYHKLLTDSVTEFDEIAVCLVALHEQNNQQRTQSNCVNVGYLQGSYINAWYAKGDSLFNGKHYKKITYYSQFNNSTTFEGLMREDTVAKKVYFIQYCNTNEELLYNFSLMQGDTISYTFPNSNTNNITSGVFTLDSIRIKQDYQSQSFKHFYFKNHAAPNNSVLEMIEGVGNVSNPLFLYYPFITGAFGRVPKCTPASFDEALSCKWNNGTKIYADSILAAYVNTHGSSGGGGPNSCTYCLGILGGINQYNNSETVTILPNPNNGNFSIETNLNTKQTLQMFDVNGRLVLTQTINGKASIDANQLPEGVYNISIISDAGVTNKRVVIVK